MKTTVSQDDFINAFRTSDNYKNNFSYEGLKALYEYIESYEEDTGEEIELDVIAFCCDFAEYTLEEFKQDYEDYEDYKDIESLEELEEEDFFIATTEINTILIRQF